MGFQALLQTVRKTGKEVLAHSNRNHLGGGMLGLVIDFPAALSQGLTMSVIITTLHYSLLNTSLSFQLYNIPVTVFPTDEETKAQRGQVFNPGSLVKQDRNLSLLTLSHGFLWSYTELPFWFTKSSFSLKQT